MFCPKCGSAIAQEDKFCRKCGGSVTQPQPINPAYPMHTPRPVMAQEFEKPRWWVILLGVLLIFTCIGMIIGIPLLVTESKKRLIGTPANNIGWVIAGFIFIGMLLIGAASSNTNKNSNKSEVKSVHNTTVSNTQATTSSSSTKPDIELISDTTESNDFAWYITGTVKNNTTKEYEFVHIEYILYDDTGAQVGTTTAGINNLEANGILRFKTTYITEKNATKYKLKEISKY